MSDIQVNVFEIWSDQANQHLLRLYGIDFDDAGLSNQEIIEMSRDFKDPTEFVEWYGQKYDLIPIPEGMKKTGRLRSPLKP